MASYAFDEFGNMIGGESSDDEAEQPPPAEEEELSVAPMDTDEPEEESRAITLHEDKQYYPEASEVYGEKVKTVVLDDDTGHDEARTKRVKQPRQYLEYCPGCETPPVDGWCTECGTVYWQVKLHAPMANLVR